jgi:hypothetical protein
MQGRKHVYMAEAGEAEGGGGEVVEEVVKADEVSPEIEAEAKRMGWTPKDQFKGDPDKWRGADEFVERGRNMLPIVRATVKKQEREIAELKQSMKEFGEFHTKTEQRAYAQALADLKQQRADAIAAGDGVAFDKVDSAIDDLKKDIETKGKPAKTDDSDPVFDDWKIKNKWLDDPKMEAFGNSAANYLRSIGEKSTGADFLELVTKEVKAKFPDKFENPRRSSAPSVEGGAPAARSGGKSFADMPAEARAACERMARNGYADKPKEAAAFKAEYVKTFFAD